jgi:hypothetical protein
MQSEPPLGDVHYDNPDEATSVKRLIYKARVRHITGPAQSLSKYLQLFIFWKRGQGQESGSLRRSARRLQGLRLKRKRVDEVEIGEGKRANIVTVDTISLYQKSTAVCTKRLSGNDDSI